MTREEAIQKVVEAYRVLCDLLSDYAWPDGIEFPDRVPNHILNLALSKTSLEDEGNILFDELSKTIAVSRFTIGIREVDHTILVYPELELIKNDELQEIVSRLSLSAKVVLSKPTKILLL